MVIRLLGYKCKLKAPKGKIWILDCPHCKEQFKVKCAHCFNMNHKCF